jgi:hypothetical protein
MQLFKAARKITLNPQPCAVQSRKRRKSGKRPVGDHGDLVVVQVPATANHRVRKCSHSHRSPKITPTAQTPTPPSHISPISPLPIRLPLLFVPAYGLLVLRVCGCIPMPNAHRRSRKQTHKTVLLALQHPCMSSLTLGP